MLKKDRADIEAERILEIEIKNASRQRYTDTVFIAICCIFLFFFGVAIFMKAPDTFSDEENRSLQVLPAFNLKNFTSGQYTQDIGEFYSDQFPFRNFFVGIKGFSEIAMLKEENNDVMLGADDYLIKRIEYTEDSYELAIKNLSAVNDFSQAMKDLGIDFNFALAPRAIDIMKFKLPENFSYDRAKIIWDIVNSSKAYPLVFNEELEKAAMNGDYVWFKTDHHWTVRGAYIAYCELAESLELSPYPENKFIYETVSDSFQGTTYSSGGIKWTKKDSLEIMRYSGDEAFTVTDIITGQKLSGLYDFSYIEAKDKYSVFLGGNSAHISIEYSGSENSSRKKMLIIKDSFSHSVIPFLAAHYDIEVVDLRYYKGSIYNYISENSFDSVLIFYGIDTVATSDSLWQLKYGLK